MNYKLLFICCIFPMLLFGQKFDFESTVSKIEKEGFYKIELSPEMRAKSTNNLEDLRIFNAKNEEIPYLLAKASISYSKENLIPFKIKSFKTFPKKNESEYVIENPKQLNLNGFILEVANTSDEKYYALSGSEDGNTWFSIASNQLLYDLETSEKTSSLKQIDFPETKYKFYKITFNDYSSNPINILKIGTLKKEFLTSLKNQLEIPIKNTVTKQLKTSKQTEITIFLADFYTIDAIEFKISKPEMYHRDAKIQIKTEQIINKSTLKSTFIDEDFSAFILDSKSKNYFTIEELKVKQFKLLIDNFDNAALEISAIKLFQTPIYLKTNLKTDEIYTLKTGNKTLSSPSYDLNHFKTSIGENLPIIKTEKIVSFQVAEVKKEEQFYQKSWFMWICIAFGGLVLGYFSLQMLKEMKSQ